MMDLTVMPKINKAAGMEVSGVVEAVGKNVKKFKPGDEVMAITAGYHGGWVEYVCASVNVTAIKLSILTFEEAATMCLSGISAYGAVNLAKVTKNQNVLVYGASGGVGQYVVQLAKMRGAKVTGVCSTRNLDICRRFGADEVIDYKKEDFSNSGKSYDVVFGINGNNPLWKYKKVLKKAEDISRLAI
jgi:NADPH:quinone reductase-like Zn-dependent oxidoreductase